MVALSTLASGLGVAGQDTGSRATHTVAFAMNVPVEMRDGVRLATDIYRPASEGTFPVILVRTPYGSESPGHSTKGQYYGERGYVYAVQDVRGKYDSGGDWYGRRDEGEDGYDTIDWLARQPWSSGSVGMVGGSYLGLVQWEVAALGNPHLKAIVPIVSPATLGRTTEEYAPLAIYGRGSSARSELSWLVSTDGRVNQNTAAYDWDTLFWHLPLGEIPKLLGRDIPIWTKLVRSEIGLWEDYLGSAARDRWVEVVDDWPEPAVRYRRVSVPALQVTGWFDGSTDHSFYNRAMVLQHAEEPLARNQWIVVGPWPHRVNATTRIGELDFGSEAVIDLDALVLRWFDHWLKGVPNGIPDEAPLRLFVMGENRWKQAWSWPIEGAQSTSFYLDSGGRANTRAGDGRLTEDLPGRPGMDRYTYDPGAPTPAITGGENSEMVDDGPVDVRSLEDRSDVLVYSGPTLDSPVEVTGPVQAELYVSSSAPETHFIVRLLDVHPSGASFPVWYTYANAFTARFGTESVEASSGIRKLEIQLPSTSHVFGAGHRIRVHVTSAAFPLFRNLNTGEDPATGTAWRVANQTLYHGPMHRSRVILPVVDRP